MKWTKFSRVQRLFATPNGRKSKQEYSIIIENSRNRIMFLWPFVLFNSEASFSKQDFESMDSTLLFLATTFSGLSFVFSARYTDPNVPQPNLFSFSKSFHSNFGNSGSFFAFLFRLVGILKLAVILFHLTKKEKPWERVAILVKFWREIVVLVRVLLIESSPRFTNRVQSAFY